MQPECIFTFHPPQPATRNWQLACKDAPRSLYMPLQSHIRSHHLVCKAPRPCSVPPFTAIPRASHNWRKVTNGTPPLDIYLYHLVSYRFMFKFSSSFFFLTSSFVSLLLMVAPSLMSNLRAITSLRSLRNAHFEIVILLFYVETSCPAISQAVWGRTGYRITGNRSTIS